MRDFVSKSETTGTVCVCMCMNNDMYMYVEMCCNKVEKIVEKSPEMERQMSYYLHLINLYMYEIFERFCNAKFLANTPLDPCTCIIHAFGKIKKSKISKSRKAMPLKLHTSLTPHGPKENFGHFESKRMELNLQNRRGHANQNWFPCISL